MVVDAIAELMALAVEHEQSEAVSSELLSLLQLASRRGATAPPLVRLGVRRAAGSLAAAPLALRG